MLWQRGPGVATDSLLPDQTDALLRDLIGSTVVLDLQSHYVCLGRLESVGPDFLELRNADFHDLRDTQTSRENYIAESRASGIKRNRKRVLVRRGDVVAISRMKDIVER
jgi:hypothetical protein